MMGFGNNIHGTQIKAITRMKNWRVSCQLCPLYPHILLLPSGLSPVFPIESPIFIIVEIIEGAH